MRTVEYLDELKRRTGLDTDYKLARALGVMTSQMSQYRRGGTFGDPVAMRVAELLDLHPGVVVADMRVERAKFDNERAVWQDVADKLRSLAAAVLLVLVGAAFVPAENSAQAMAVVLTAGGDLPRYTLYVYLSWL